MVVKKVKKLSQNDKLEKILKNQDKILKSQNIILKKEKTILNEEMKIEKEETNIEQKSEQEILDELLKFEKKIDIEKNKPLYDLTKKDLFKGFVGASFGILGHFSFTKGVDLALTLNMLQVSILYVVGLVLLIIMLYYTGFRKVKKHLIFSFMPVRILVLYGVSIVAIILINLLFGKISFPIDIDVLYKIVGTNIILAVLGAGTADLIGKNDH